MSTEKPVKRLQRLNDQLSGILKKFQDETGFRVVSVDISRGFDIGHDKSKSEEYLYTIATVK